MDLRNHNRVWLCSCAGPLPLQMQILDQFFLTITYLKGPSVQIITIQYVPILHVEYTDQLSIYWIQGCVF